MLLCWRSRLPWILTASLIIAPVRAWAQAAPRQKRNAVLAMAIDHDPTSRDRMFAVIAGVAVSHAGDIYVLDANPSCSIPRPGPNHCGVKEFDSTGKLLRVIGQPGFGNGKFNRPVNLVVDGTSIRVFDEGQSEAQIFSLDGRFIRTVKLATTGAGIEFSFSMRGGTTLVNVPALGPGSNSGAPKSPMQRLLFRGDPAHAPDTLISYRDRIAVSYPPNGRIGSMPSRFGNGGAWALSGDSLVATVDGYSGLVKWYAVAAASRSATLFRTDSLLQDGRPIASEELVLESDRITAMAIGVSSRGGNGSAVDRVRVVDPPPRWSVASVAVFADDGSLWVGNPPLNVGSVGGAPYYTASSTTWTVFPVQGDTYSVSLPPDFTVCSVSRGDIYGRGLAPSGLAVVRVYRLEF